MFERGKVTIVRQSLRDYSFGAGTKLPCSLASNEVITLVGERTRQSTHPDFVSIKLTYTHTWQMALLLNVYCTCVYFYSHRSLLWGHSLM